MNEIQIRLCFESRSFNGKSLVELIRENQIQLGFEMKRLRCSELKIPGKKYSLEKALKVIEKLGTDLRFSFESQNFSGPQFWVSHPGHPQAAQVFNWSLPYDNFLSVDFSTMTQHEKFVIGYCYDIDYHMWENEIMISNYELLEKSHTGLPKYFDSLEGMEVIDISNNPGRMDLVAGMWLGATWRMYFGKPFFEYVPKEKLLSFPEAYHMEELENGVVFIQLYEKLFESSGEENRALQQSFREWVGMDELVKQLS